MQARSEQIGQLLPEGDYTPHGKTARHPLGEGHQVRSDSSGQGRVLEGEPVSGSTHACLDLVNNHQGLVVIAEAAHRGNISRVKWPDPGFALDQLHDDGCDRPSGRVRENRLHGIDVSGRNELHTWDQGGEGLPDTRFPGDAQRPHTAPVESPGQGDDSAWPAAFTGQHADAMEPGHLECGLIGLGSRIGEVDMGTLRRPGYGQEAFGQLDLRPGGEVVADMGHAGGLVLQRPVPGGVGIPHGVDGDPGHHIQVAIPIQVPDVDTLTMVHDPCRTAKDIHVGMAVTLQPVPAAGTDRGFNQGRGGLPRLPCSGLTRPGGHGSPSFLCRRREPPWSRCRSW